MSYTIWPDGVIGKMLQEVYRERLRQYELKEKGKFKHCCSDKETTHFKNFAILGEEFGEVSRCINESIDKDDKLDLPHLQEELIQVAAVCVGWAEKIDNELQEQIKYVK